MVTEESTSILEEVIFGKPAEQPTPTEKPVEDTPVSELPKIEKNKPVEQAKTEEAKPEIKPDFNPYDIIKTVSGGKIGDEISLKETISKAELAQQMFDDPDLKALYEHKKNGGETKKFYEYQSIDYASLDKDEVLKMRLKQEYPDANSTQINALYNKKYGEIDPEDKTDEAEVSRMEKERDYKEALTKFEAQKVKELAKSPEQIERERQNSEYVAQFQKEGELHVNTHDEANFEYSVKDMELPDTQNDFTFSYKRTPEDRELFKKLHTDPLQLIGMFYNQDGTFNRARYDGAIAFINNPKAFLTAAVNQAVADERDRFVKGLQNADPAKMASPPPAQKTEKEERDEFILNHVIKNF